jgi:hypothetical protein
LLLAKGASFSKHFDENRPKSREMKQPPELSIWRITCIA